MSKPAKWIFGALVLLAVLSVLWLRFRPTQTTRPVARITLDGELVEEIDLAAQVGTRTLVVTGKSGLTNTIVAEPGRIWVEKADCPDQICVHQGVISDGTTPIVCLPNQLIIEIVGGGDGLDAAAG
jgi:hypothetical protein